MAFGDKRSGDREAFARPFLLLGGGLAALFASTFVLLALLGGFGAEEARTLVEAVSQIDRIWVAALLMGLLFADLFVAMPTLTLCLISGFYLGPWLGGATASAGMLLAGTCGYGLSRRFGTKALRRICPDEKRLEEAVALFSKRAPLALLLCRASPILPEVSSCLAGAAKMRFSRYLAYFGMATVPYAFVAARAGSISTIDDPRPAMAAAIGISLTLWLLWWRLAARWSGAGSPRANNGAADA